MLGNGSTQSASCFEVDTSMGRPHLFNGGLHFPPAEMVFISPPRPPSTFSARRAAVLGDAVGPSLSDSKEVVMGHHVNWGCASGQQLERLLADSDGESATLLGCVAEVLQ